MLSKCNSGARVFTHSSRRAAKTMTASSLNVDTRFMHSQNETHQVFNQSTPFDNIDLWESDRPLQRAMKSLTTSSFNKDNDDAASKVHSSVPNSSSVHMRVLQKHGKISGSASMNSYAKAAEVNKPILQQYDNYGRRVDIIQFDPAYHAMMYHGISSGATSYGYNQTIGEGQLNGHLVRAGLMCMQNEIDPGHCCPLVMTSAVIPVFQAAAAAAIKNGKAETTKGTSSSAQFWLDRTISRHYDPTNTPIENKKGVTIGMSMTEKQGGSDVKANTTTAMPENSSATGEGEAYRLIGHKWFTSAPMCDGFLTLAKVPSSTQNLSEVHSTCFLVPRWLPDSTRNTGFKIMRLKDKMGDKTNASSEVEYHNAYGQMIGQEGKGLQTILQMVQMTRLDCTIGAASGARKALSLALNHASGRSAFGKSLIDQPMMENVLTDLCVMSEACTLSMMRMAAAHARSTCGIASGLSTEIVQHEAKLFRVGVAIMKYYCTKVLPQFSYECMEVFGGNGFTEDFPMAKLFRHSPLNSIWEGSGNVMALDVLRALNAIPTFLQEMSQDIQGIDPFFDAYCVDLHKILHEMQAIPPALQNAGESQRYARFLVDRLAIGFQASLLLKYGHENGCAADAFLQSKIRPAVHIHINGGNNRQTQNNNDSFALGGSGGLNYGASAIFSKSTAKAIIADHMPVFCK